MAKAKKKKVTKRDDELSGRPEVRERLEKVFEHVEKGFEGQRERADRILDNWDAYNCILGRYQNYSGMSKIFVPIIRNAVVAMVTRYINQAFPQSGRHIEAVTGEADQPFALISLMEHYIAKGKWRTQAVPAILTNGQVEGQYNAYMHWDRIERWVVSRETKPIEDQELGLTFDEVDQVEEQVERRIDEEMPLIEALHDADVLVLPATAPSVEWALNNGGSYTVVRRWSKDMIEEKIDAEEIDEDAGEQLLEAMNVENPTTKDTAKSLAHSAGIYISGKALGCVVYETWTKCEVDGRKRLCRAYFAGEPKILGCRLNPFWNDRCPGLSAPVKKLPGVFKGEAPVSAAMDMQVLANDMANEAADQMYYTLAPVLAVDPEKVSKWKELVADVAAVWPVEPGGVKMLEWPNKAREAMEIIQFCKSSAFETLGVNPGMLPQQTGRSGKRNQAEIALEQQVDVLTTSDAVTNLEGEILTPAVCWSAEMDHQFREKPVLVRMFGELGMAMGMERVPPIQMGNKWRLVWSGVESARNAAQIQQQIGFLGTVMKVPPQFYMGYRLDLSAAIEHMMSQVMPARLARQTFRSLKDELSVDPKVENDMLGQGFQVRVHAQDNDPQHLQVHMQGPQTPEMRAHIQMHQMAMQMKQAAMAAQGQPGQPGGGRGPRPGAMPAQGPKRQQQPAGTIHNDQMARAGAPVMPRR